MTRSTTTSPSIPCAIDRIDDLSTQIHRVVQGLAAIRATLSPAPKSALPSSSTPEQLNRLVEEASRLTGSPVYSILNKRRTKEVVEAKHAIYYVARVVMTFPYATIARFLGVKKHTVLAGVAAAESRLSIKEKNFTNLVTNLTQFSKDSL